MLTKIKVSIASDPNVKVMSLNSDKLHMEALQIDSVTAFVGVASTNAFYDLFPTKALADLLIRGFNNRTRERNYYRLYSSLLQGDISDDDFDKEIESNPDRYVIPMNGDSSQESISTALHVVPQLMDINTAGDFESAFSFKEGASENYCKSLSNE